MTRIAIGQIRQETNSFNPVLTERSDFENYGLVFGPDVLDRYGDVGELSGFSELPKILGHSVKWVGLCRAVAWSGGPLTAGLLPELIEMVREPLRSSSVEGVLFSLHGAQSSVDDPDVSGIILQAIRNAIGPEVPLVATLDLHANLTPLMVRSADVLIGYHTYPHVDENSTGARAATVLSRLLNTEKRPEVSVWKIPMVRNCEGSSTDRGILSDLWQKVVTTEQQDDVVSIGLYPVQPWLDAPQLGWSFYQAYWGVSPPLNPQAVARECWATRDYSEAGEFLSPDKLVGVARTIEGGPVVVSEGYDATNSGAPGDSTHLLDALLTESPGKGGSLAFCVDPESVDCCTRSGVDAVVDLCLGGKRDPYSKPLLVRAQVKQLGELSYRLSGHGGHNFPVQMGRMARITIRDVTVVLVEKTGPGSTPLLYEVAGADPRSFKVVLVKSPSGFRNDYESFAAGIIFCSAPGAASRNLNHFEFMKTTRPLYPWDNLIDMEHASWAGLMKT